MSEPTRETTEPRAREDLDDLFRREHRPLVRLATLLVGTPGPAEEVVQDAFAVVGERWDTLDNPGGYLRTTVVNGCRMVLRRRALERRHPVDEPTTIDGPAELVELRAALDTLSERARVAVVLRYFAGLRDAEIADVLGCRVGTVRSTIHRALRALREELS